MIQFSSEFGAHFQLHFVAHLLRDAEFLNAVKQDLRAEFFADDYLSRIVRFCLAFNATNGGTPGGFLHQTIHDLRSRGALNEDVASRLSLYTDKLLKVDLDNRTYLLDRFAEFARYAQIEANLQDFISAAKTRDFGEANKLLKSMITSPRSTDLGREFIADPDSRITRRVQEDEARLLTGVPQIDQHIDGLRAGELGVMQSRLSSDGKTAALVLLARNFCHQGKRVLFIVLEGSVEGLEDRLDMSVGGLRKEELTGKSVDGDGIDYELTDQKVRWAKQMNTLFKAGGRIWMKKFPAYSTTVSQIADYAKELEAATGFRPDVIVCDYLDLCAPETPALRSDLYSTGKEVYTRFIQWMEELRVPAWTVMQSNRLAAEKNVADQQHAGGSLTKIQLATVVISINRSDDDKITNTINLFVVKNREGAARYSIPVQCDFETMRFWAAERNVNLTGCNKEVSYSQVAPGNGGNK